MLQASVKPREVVPVTNARSSTSKYEDASALPAIKLTSLSKVCRRKWGKGHTLAVDRLDLDLHQGELFGFLGSNGAGKTSVIKIILGLMQPTAGRVAL